MLTKHVLLLLCVNLLHVEMARILVVVPVPSISHQIELRSLTQELAKRGHDVVIMTSYPAFPKGHTPANLTEIDLKEVAYGIKKFVFAESATGKNNDIFNQIKAYFSIFNKIFEGEILTKEVQDVINDKSQHFDLLIIEACVRPALVFSHIYKAPVILFSSVGALDMFLEYTGSAMHPLLYPSCLHQKLTNLTLWEKAQELYKHYYFEDAIASVEAEGDEILRKHFGEEVPPLKELRKNVDMVFLSEYHIWDNNRPVPPGLIYLGGIHPPDKPSDLPKEMKSYLDSSKNGVIYMSLGTNVDTRFLSDKVVKILLKVFAKLPYDVLLKWDADELPGAPKNVKIMNWLPQSDLLHHPKIMLFIMQGGLQSTGDAIKAGVPLLGLPMLGDQWYNVEQFKRLKIGVRVDPETMTEEVMLTAIRHIIDDKSFKQNIIALRDMLLDQPQSALERAVWWTEYVIRNKGARHLRAPTALISYWDYFELDLIMTFGVYALMAFGLLIVMSYVTVVYVSRFFKKVKIE